MRPGDLVALDGDVVVWRWWHGTVTSLDGAMAHVERNVTQREDGDPRRAAIPVAVPDELAADVEVGTVVYFGQSDEGQLTVVATAASETVVERMAPRLPGIATALG